MNGEEMQNSVFLEFKNVTKRYGERIAVSHADFSIYREEIHGILGENGSGKTTLLQLISGICTPDEGQMLLLGQPYHPQSPADALAHGIISIQNVSSLMDNLSVAENTMKGMYPRKRFLGMIDWTRLYHDCEGLYKSLGLKMDVYALAQGLTVQEKRMVELARAYLCNARMVIIDEPDLSTDDVNYPTIMLLLDRIIQAGGSVVIATHRIEEILKIAHRMTILENGQVCYSDESSSTNRQKILQLMAGRQGALRDIYPKLKEFSGYPILSLSHVTTNGGLRDISLDLHKGEILGVSSLASKPRTALARAIFGLDDVIMGDLSLYGEKVVISSPSDAVQSGINYLSEDRVEWGLQNEFPIPHNISLGNLKEIGTLGLIRKRKEERAALSYVRKFNIKMVSLWEKVANLSTGNQQKVLLARSLFSNCKILILEEPTKNIDKSSKIEVYNFMSSFVGNGGSIIFISSHIEELIGMCDRIITFNSSGNYSIFKREKFNKEIIIEHGL